MPRPLRITATVVAVLAVVGALFWVGVLIGSGSGTSADPNASSADSAQTTPPATLNPSAAVPATATATVPTPSSGLGVTAWDALAVGDCIAPFVSAWESTFTTVDCATPHAARLVARASFNADPAAAYPGDLAITEGLAITCTDPTVLSPELVAAAPDLLWQASYPASADAWAAGQRDYFCFVARPAGEPLPAVG